MMAIALIKQKPGLKMMWVCGGKKEFTVECGKGSQE